MKNLHIAATKSSPEVHFDGEKKILTIRGESYPENTAEFYIPVFACIQECLAALDRQELTVNVELTYFNSSSSKVLLDLFDLLDDAMQRGQQVVVNWLYRKEYQSALEAGKKFQEELDVLTFNFIRKDA